MLLDREKCLDKSSCHMCNNNNKLDQSVGHFRQGNPQEMAEEITESVSNEQQAASRTMMTTNTQQKDSTNECNNKMNKTNQPNNQQTDIKLESSENTGSRPKKLNSVVVAGGIPPPPKDIFVGNSAIPPAPPLSIAECSNPDACINLQNILNSFNAPLSEEQAWALIYQSVKLYKHVFNSRHDDMTFPDAPIPENLEDISVHNSGDIHVTLRKKDGDHDESTNITSHKKILRNLGMIVYTALDFNLQAEDEYIMSQELEQLISHMTTDDADDDDCIDEGIDEGYKRWDDDNETKDLDYVLEACINHVKPTVPDDHYKAVCRALVTEALELRIFLQKVFNDDTEALRIKADSQTSKQELAKLGFNDWARFWVQVVDELRRGVRLKKNTYSRTPIEFELTPYEILMEDIRTRKYNLRKVMVNGDIPPRVKKDAHALILEFIRSRPPLRKASERKLPPPIKRTPSPREQLMDSIRKGQQLRPVPPPTQPQLKDRLLPPPPSSQTVETLKKEEKSEAQCSPRSKQRLIKVDFSLLQDDNIFDDSPASGSSSIIPHTSSICSQPKMPPYPIGGYMPATGPAPTANLTSKVMRRTSI